MPRSFADRLQAIGTDPDVCWIWRQGIGRNGYARVVCSINGDYRRRLAHRAAYELLVGAIPTGMVLDHLCGNSLCVNPKHLEPVFQRENVMRSRGVAARNAEKTHCQNGHEFTPENTYRWRAKGERERACKQCGREGLRRRYWKARGVDAPPPKRAYTRRETAEMNPGCVAKP